MSDYKNLLLGGSGFIGRNVISFLQNKYFTSAPPRGELDLLNADTVRQFLSRSKFDAVIHLATPTGHNPVDKQDEIFERSLQVFESLAYCSDLYGKLIYIGSGAEYGKHRAIVNVSEKEFGKELPQGSYGLSRYIMSEIAEKHNNIYNLRVFGCYGAGDYPYKLMPHVINCIKSNQPIKLKQNVLFDFLYVKDIAAVIEHFIENTPKHKAYNLTSGTPVLIGDIAAEIRRQMKSNAPIVFKQEGRGLEYTGNNDRLRSEIPHWLPTSIEAGILEVLENENRKY
jgi:GDP-L-fucose synthase